MRQNYIPAGYVAGSQDGTGVYAVTLDDLQAYGNHRITFDATAMPVDFDAHDTFVSLNGNGTFTGALIDDYEGAYMLKETSGVALALVMAGALLGYIWGTSARIGNLGPGGALQLTGGTLSDRLQFNTGDTVTHQGRSFSVIHASDGTDVDWFTALDGSPVVISYGVPVTVTSLTPPTVVDGTFSNVGTYTGRTVDGIMLNPGNRATELVNGGTQDSNYYGNRQGYDSLPDPTYDASLNLGSSVTLTEGTIRQAISDRSPHSNLRPALLNGALVHVIENAPASVDVFRSGQSSAAPGVTGTKAAVDAYVAALPLRPVPSDWSFDIQAAVDHWRIPEPVQHTFGNNGREIYPGDRTQTGNGYGRGYARFLGACFRALYTQTYSLGFRQALAVAMVQAGIDLHDRTYNEGGEYPGNGGLNNGRWALAAFAATVLGDAEMKANVAMSGAVRGIPNIARWHEIGQIITYDTDHLDDRGLFNRPSADFMPGTGYQVGDILSLDRGVILDNLPPKFIVDAVDGSGAITDLHYHTNGYHYVLPLQEQANIVGPLPLSGGSGSGAGLSGRKWQIVHPGMVGQLGWADNPTERRTPNAVNTATAQSYHHININGNLPLAITMRHLTGMMETVDAQDWFDIVDRQYFTDAGSSSETPQAWALEDWVMYRGFSQTGAPTVVSSGVAEDGRSLWMRFDRELRMRFADRPAAADLVVNVNGTPAARPVDGMFVFGEVVIFGVDTAIMASDSVTVTYTPNAAPARLQDHSGNAVAAFTDLVITNTSSN